MVHPWTIWIVSFKFISAELGFMHKCSHIQIAWLELCWTSFAMVNRIKNLRKENRNKWVSKYEPWKSQQDVWEPHSGQIKINFLCWNNQLSKWFSSSTLAHCYPLLNFENAKLCVTMREKINQMEAIELYLKTNINGKNRKQNGNNSLIQIQVSTKVVFLVT